MTKDIREVMNISKETPIKRLVTLKKDIARYEEQVNKCDISATNVLADSIGADIDFLRFSGMKNTDEQKREIESLENQFSNHMNNLSRCRCVKKIGK